MQQISTLCLLHLIEVWMNKKYETANMTFCDQSVIKFDLDDRWSNQDRKQSKEINVSFKKLVNELKRQLAMNKRILEEANEENQPLKQQLNLSLYKSDSLEQFGRRENLRIYNVPESANKKDDGEDIIIEIAKLLNVDLKE